jgi:anti-sigma regulatory factor (Ser/Thr protein kinase)/PAS domain-containing protein
VRYNYLRTLITILILFTISSASAQEIQLLDKDMFLRSGFDAEWTTLHQFDSSWTKLEADPARKKMRIADQPLPDLPKRSFLSLKTIKPENFTLVIPFVNQNSYTSPGLYIHRMGNNWEIYLNGKLIKSEVHLDNDGNIIKKRNLRHIHILFNSQYLKQGKNILAVRIIGDPTNIENGISLFPVYIDENESIMANASEITTLMLIFTYLVFGVYHIFLYINNRKELYNLFFGLVSLEFFLYIFFRTHIVYSLIPYSDIVIKGELTILYTIVPTFGAFAGLIVKKKIETITMIYAAFYLLLILITIPAPEALQEDILRIWQISAIVPTLYYLFYTVGYSYMKQVRRFKDKGLGIIRSILRGLGVSVPGNLLIGMFVVVACMFFDILDAIYLNLGLSVSKYGFFFLIVGIAMVLSNRFVYIYKTVEKLNQYLEEKITDLNEANHKISLSEEKYKLLVEGSNEVIFTLDENYCFKTVNRAIREKLGLFADQIIGDTFMEFVEKSSDGRSMEFKYIAEKFEELKEHGKPVFFKIDYAMPSTMDVIDFNIRLEYINIEGSNEILGKISRVSEDSLLKFFKKEKSIFNIGNQLTTAEEISHRITRNLNRYLDHKEVNNLRIAIREMIINAIEHGNFEISFEEKTEALDNDNYFKTLAMKQKDINFNKRTVEIEYRITPTVAEFSITDQGKGFDHQKVLKRVNEANEEMLSHGRGIIMASNVFDEIKFNNKGNQVVLVKRY